MHLVRRGGPDRLVIVLIVGMIFVPVKMTWSAATPIKLGEVGPLSPPSTTATIRMTRTLTQRQRRFLPRPSRVKRLDSLGVFLPGGGRTAGYIE